MILLNQFSLTVIVLWSMFCIFSPVVNDGVAGKILYCCLLLSCFSMLTSGGSFRMDSQSLAPQDIMLLSIAMIGARHIFLKTIWPSVKNYYIELADAYSLDHEINKRRETDKGVNNGGR